MGYALATLPEAARVTATPSLLVATTCSSVVLLVGTPFLFPLFILGPVVIVGLLAMADVAHRGERPPTYADFRRGIREYWIHLQLAYGLYVLATSILFFLVASVAALLVVLLAGVGLLLEPTAFVSGEPLFLSVILLALLALAVVSAVPDALAGFFDAVIVLDGADGITVWQRSWALVRDAPVSVAGYTLLRTGLFSLLLVAPGAGGVAFGFALSLEFPWLLALATGGLLVGLVGGLSFAMAYHVVYVRRILELEEPRPAPTLEAVATEQ